LFDPGERLNREPSIWADVADVADRIGGEPVPIATVEHLDDDRDVVTAATAPGDRERGARWGSYEPIEVADVGLEAGGAKGGADCAEPGRSACGASITVVLDADRVKAKLEGG
jgi:hypothetical protein